MSDRDGGGDTELEKTVTRLLRTHAGLHDSFVAAPGKTIQPARRSLVPARNAPAKDEQTRSSRPPAGDSGLELGETLGRGGMGVVRRAKQVVLDRDVAVKSIQPRLASEAATRMLMQEAFTLGRIEHPNILPIYDVRQDHGEPCIVLKKIEGIEWSALMHRADLIAEEFRGQEALEWNLSVLLQVCNAVDFAHSRGIMHRDLKPENVMIGEFGEVYVMDWGLALALEDDGSGRFPLAKDADQLAGTPQYMAPEMLGGAAERMGAKTDVYLLGAILYEIVTGHAPHRGRDMKTMLSSVVGSRPAIDPACPSELAGICRTAMDPDPGWRYESVEAFRLALTGFVRHAGSRRLETQASERAQTLIDLIGPHSAPLPAPTIERVQRLFAESRFAFRQALEIWPDNARAADGLRRLTCAMIEHELDHHNPRSAANLLLTVDNAEAGLSSRVAAAVAEAEQSELRMADLERSSRQLDTKTGGRERAIGAGVLGLVWAVAPVLMDPGFLGTRLPGHRIAVWFVGAVLGGLALWAVAARAELAESRITRQMMAGGAVAMLGQLALEAIGHLLQFDARVIETLWPLVWFSVSAMLVVAVDRRLLPMPLCFLVTLISSAQWPSIRFYAMGVANLVATVNMVLVWLPLERRRDA